MIGTKLYSALKKARLKGASLADLAELSGLGQAEIAEALGEAAPIAATVLKALALEVVPPAVFVPVLPGPRAVAPSPPPRADVTRMRNVAYWDRRRHAPPKPREIRTRFEGVMALPAPDVRRIRKPTANVVRYAGWFLHARWKLDEVAELFGVAAEDLISAMEAA